MAGKLCFGSVYANAGAGHLQSSKAFCEGMQYRSEGTAVEQPKIDNPLQAGSEASLAWALGWDFAEAAAGGTISTKATCCQITGIIAA